MTKERPILFSAPMVRALLAGTKTQTRRVCKPAQAHALSCVVEVPDPQERGQVYNRSHFGDEDGGVQFASPYGGKGDRLWVREAFGYVPTACGSEECVFAADYTDGSDKAAGVRYKPSIHMPRAASRILLEITDVRVERLQDISEADAIAEGIERPEDMSAEAIAALDIWEGAERRCFDALNQPIHQYRRLWDQINGEGAWEANPWAWAITFRRMEGQQP